MTERYRPDGRIEKKYYESELLRLQEELVSLQDWIKHTGMRVAIIFEGRDAAGKGGVIKRITQRLNARVVKVVALGIPTEREKSQWYFQRYAPHLPGAGEMVLFDRSWYNRAGVERVMGFCTDDEYREFLRSCPDFERMLVNSGMILIKYWFAIRAPRNRTAFHSPAPLAQRKLLTPSGVGNRRKTQTLTCPLNRGRSNQAHGNEGGHHLRGPRRRR